jgi:hypothetical protein
LDYFVSVFGVYVVFYCLSRGFGEVFWSYLNEVCDFGL